MVEKEYDGYKLVCDDCLETEDQPFDTFDEAVDYAKDNGWKCKRNNGEWENICPDCQ